jgi:prepilin-type N-terminal cleavage/methylation domain-containing protein
MNKKLNKVRLGFTLIELLVVIAIIGILASIVLASLNTARLKARDARRIADIRQIQLALELYADANSQSYPASDEQGVDSVTGFRAIATKFISSVPQDPVDGTDTAKGYQYQSFLSSAGAVCNAATGCAFYQLGASLEQTDNNALKGDVDGCVALIASYCLKAFAGDTIFGADTNNCGSIASGRSCYDVTP